jgi:CDP-6-deoxy-D-xylo-4-hexulose-3-dehydrase
MKPTKAQHIREQISALVDQYANIAFAPQAFLPGATPVPPSGKLIGSAELKSMVEASLDGWLTTGRFNNEFENKLAAFIGIKHLITVNSGSSANLVAFSTLTSPKLGARAIKKGDEVITVAAGFPTTVNPIIQFGAVPVFVDVELGTYNPSFDSFKRAESDKTSGIMIAHTLGNPFDYRWGTTKYPLVADCCDALGSTYNHDYTLHEFERYDKRMKYVALSRATDIKHINII